ncbi:MAG: response regulator, partial [candidate division Zixibacteria bacterium]|nr:response regulator [candidate division Zixibacteria bacterium]
MKKARILIVEDNNGMREILMKILVNIGFKNVTGAENGKLAWEKMQKAQFDLVISDLMMPEMNGFELLKQIRNSNNHISDLPVIITTASHDVADINEALKWKINGYLTK